MRVLQIKVIGKALPPKKITWLSVKHRLVPDGVERFGVKQSDSGYVLVDTYYQEINLKEHHNAILDLCLIKMGVPKFGLVYG